MKVVLDTNTLIYFFKGVGKVKNRMLSTPPSEIALPTIVLFEIELGIAKSSSPQKRISQLKDFTSLVNVIPFGQAEAKTAAQIRAKLEKKGIPIGPYDVLIAACAKANNLILVTHNLKEFKKIEGLRLSDWY
ncbi:MAG: type II toxin-antitoxin system VapC family toxin [Deltaproteobacteria bacterium]|jgi:tRNA(fMet)-specific endonuclease VapC|nr:type II toxin-antitoxin system VapC family toxin [Deltaproteobacteria bacterium]